MNHKSTFTTALVALGIISSASAANVKVKGAVISRGFSSEASASPETSVTTNEVHVTGSTAFRANVFSAATAASGGIFDAPGGTALPAGSTSSSSLVTYVGNINGVPYALECSWTGSEAGIANVDGVNTLQNPGLPNAFYTTAANLPGDPTTFPKIDGTSGGYSGTGDLTFSDTSQAVSLTKPPAHPALYDYGIMGVVTFVWEKGVNSTGSPASSDPGDAAWSHLTNVTHSQLQSVLAGVVKANYLTGNTNDASIPIVLVGRNAGSGTHANTMLDTQYGVATAVNQFALNSTYSGAGVLTYNIVANNQAASFPTVASCLANQSDATTTPNLLGIGNDGFDSGGGVSDCMSCDSSRSEVITLGYLGLSDAKNARDGKAASGTTPAQPGGAVYLTLDGLSYNDALVINGTYSFWGHEHLYGNSGHNTLIDNAAAAIKTAFVSNASGLGTGSPTAQSSGIIYTDMLADKAGAGDTGYPLPGAP